MTFNVLYTIYGLESVVMRYFHFRIKLSCHVRGCICVNPWQGWTLSLDIVADYSMNSGDFLAVIR